jgi:hypothetical protein
MAEHDFTAAESHQVAAINIKLRFEQRGIDPET